MNLFINILYVYLPVWIIFSVCLVVHSCVAYFFDDPHIITILIEEIERYLK